MSSARHCGRRHRPERIGSTDFQRAIATSDGFGRDNLSWLGPWDIDLAAIRAPVRLVYGESDRMGPLAHGEWLRERLPDADLVVVPGGHGDATFGAADDTFAAIAAAEGNQP
jgi:pimeloyl-ACP methyl ester carboxylesterase